MSPVDFSADPDVQASWARESRFGYEAPYPPGVTPRQYQHAGVEYHLSRDHALFGDAPGLGKTLECVLLSNVIESRRNLVVCPASLRLNWEREIWRWSTIPNVRTYPTLTARDGTSPEAHYQIVSYEHLRNKSIFAALMSLRWDHLILDEAHYLKDPKGNTRTKAVCGWNERSRGTETYHPGLADVAGRTTLATGTITPNQPVECYNAIRLLNWEAINCASLDDFRNTYYELGEGMVNGPYLAKDKRGDPVWKRGPHYSTKVRNVPCNLDDLRYRLRKYVMVRRLKEHVLTELPPKEWKVFPLEVGADVRKVLASDAWGRVQRFLDLDVEMFDGSIPVDGAVSTAFRELGEATAPAVAAYVLELAREGYDKMVVGAWHRNVLAYLREKLAPLGVAYMDGSTTPRRKQAAVDSFQNDPDVGIILGQKKPLGEGWTLTAAQDAIDAEPFWVPGVNDQFLDRLHRYGQTGDHVLGHMPFVPNSLHEKIIVRVAEKDSVIHKTLDDDPWAV